MVCVCVCVNVQSGQHAATDDNVSSTGMNADVERCLQSAVSQSLASAVEQSQLVSSLSASTAASDTSHLSAQYSQFLASVRDFKPLVADLNTSIASIANSVTTVGASIGSRVPTVRADVGSQVTGSTYYVGDMRLHSPASHAPQHEPNMTPDENSQRRQIFHDQFNNGISHNSGKVQICIVTFYVSYDTCHKIISDALT